MFSITVLCWLSLDLSRQRTGKYRPSLRSNLRERPQTVAMGRTLRARTNKILKSKGALTKG